MPYLWFYGIKFFLKNRRGSQLSLAKNDWTVQIFSDFELFKNFFKISQWGKFQVIELKFCVQMHLYWVMFNTIFCENRSRPSSFRRIWIYIFFLSWHQIWKIRCIHEASLKAQGASEKLWNRTLWTDVIWTRIYVWSLKITDILEYLLWIF